MKIREVRLSDVDSIIEIYNQYINNTTVTFEEQLVTAETMRQRIDHVAAAGLPWLVVEEGDRLLGYAYAGPWKARSAYRFTVEPSIYLDRDYHHQGVGKILYTDLLNRLVHKGIKNVIGVIALPNPASIALHESLGFRKVGEFTDIGFKLETWISVGYWQLELPEEV